MYSNPPSSRCWTRCPRVSVSQCRREDLISFSFRLWFSVYFFQELSQFSFNFNVYRSIHAEVTYSTVPDFLTTENPQSIRRLWKFCVTIGAKETRASQISPCIIIYTLPIETKPEIFARLKNYGNATHKEFNQTTKFLFISICCFVFETKSATKVLVW